jgi:hypothetical protein
MAEALAAIGLASNIIQFVEFASKLIATSAEIRSNATANIQENHEIDVVTRDLQQQLGILDLAFKSSRNPGMTDLLKECISLAAELKSLVQDAQGKSGKTGRVTSMVKAFRVLRKRGAIADLEKRMNRIRDGILAHLSVLLL